MEYFDGKPLKNVFPTKIKNLKQFLRIAIAITDILGEIHQNQIIHKDINSNNILIHEQTNEVRIIDFGISSKFDLRQNNLGNPDVLEGTLAYISPEQTGRMNRIVDYRTDLYSLGVMFYELLVGRLPFEAKDSMELVHCHIARKPLAICEVNPDVPIMISEIVMRLMEKSASDRYQSAYGLKMDLMRCLEELDLKGQIELFEVGHKDYSDKLQIPQKLYGCEEEIELLLESFQRVSEGAVELMLVKGYAGVGKSSLINEVHRPITERRGYFIKGKHDQYQKNVPYSSLIQAFNDFVEQILTETPERIAKWKAKILNAVGTNGSLLIDVIPNLKYIIGDQKQTEELTSIEAANRFNYVLRRFIEILSQKDHPLVIFIDDLQWADMATLNSIKLLMTDQNNKYLMLVGAFRDNEIDQVHPLSFLVDELAKDKTAVSILHLDNLQQRHVDQLISETLKCPLEHSQALSQLVYAKTQGNAFFVNQFLKSLFEEGVLKFDFHHYAWEWDLDEIRTKNITNNVVELMASKIEKLPGNTRDVLQLASCIGDKFDLSTLSYIYARSKTETFHTLWKAVEEGLVVPLDDNYKIIPALQDADQIAVECRFQFLHDRVQQAAYQLIPELEKKRIHYQIGQLMLDNTPEEKQHDRIFDIINQLNAGLDFARNEKELEELAKLNRLGAEKAKSANAHDSAYNYLKVAMELLGTACWQKNYEESWYTYISAAETAYLIGEREDMERLISVVLAHADDILDKVKAYEVKIQAHVANHEMDTAVKTAIKVLKLLKVNFPSRPNKLHVLYAIIKFERAMKGKTTEYILNLPKMENKRYRAAVRILSASAMAAFFADKTIYALFIFKQIMLSLRYGNAYTTASAWGSVSLIYSAIRKQYKKGYFFGELSMKLMQKRNAKKLEARNIMLFNSIVRPHVEHAANGLGALKDGHQKGMESGDYEYGLHDALAYCIIGVYTGKPLLPLLETTKKFLASAIQVNQLDPMYTLMVGVQYLENLVSPNGLDVSILCGDVMDETVYIPSFMEKEQNSSVAAAYCYKLQAAVLFDEYERGLEYSKIVFDYIGFVTGTIGLPFITFLDAVLRLKLLLDKKSTDKKGLLKVAKTHLKAIRVWEEYAPANFKHRGDLIEAQYAECVEDYAKAEAFYQEAIKGAQENAFMSDEAYGMEQFAKFWMRRGNKAIAAMYMKQAYLVYQKWGALSKLEHLKATYYEMLLPAEMPNLQTTKVEMVDLMGGRTSRTTSSMHTTKRYQSFVTTQSKTGTRGTSMLDFASLIKASHTISEEVNMERLLDKMLLITIENAGAERGVFVRHEGNTLVVLAEVHTDSKESISLNVPVSSSDGVPSSMIHYVARTKKNVVLGNASEDSTYSFDPYIKKKQPKSVFCFPLMNQGKLSGIIYLENNLTTNAFTDDRLEILDLLSAQVAISLENAALYNNLEQKVEERTHELNKRNEELKSKNEKITSSIRYAQTIQHAMLPTDSQLAEAFQEYFLLYRPKDIVSGDFYWLHEEDGITFVAVADCTGHGVPGAFMSMIGESLLNDIVNEKKVYDPAAMLELLNVGIRIGLKQHETDNDDGMDVCLCAIQKEKNGAYLIKYAGAKRPLYYVKGGRLGEIRGDNKEIGGYFKRKEKLFMTQQFHLNQGDMLFLTSDGYADQANHKHKRLGSPLLKELLQANAKHPAQKQK
ncbi:MAG: AAA family ATPase, partial [Flammeovirgaceae bacterium]